MRGMNHGPGHDLKLSLIFFLIGRFFMKCPKCDGFMLYEEYQDGTERFLAWRCIICGEVYDEIILSHKLRVKRGVMKKVREKAGIS